MGEAIKIRIIKTNNFKPWTEHLARRIGIEEAHSSRLLLIDIDHIATRKLIETVLGADCDVMKFRRRLGILDKDGRLRERGRRVGPPGNCFMIDKDLYLSVEGSGRLWHRLRKMGRKGEISFCKTEERPVIYVFPLGRFCGGDRDADPFGLFHSLSRGMKEYEEAEAYIGAR